MNDVWPDFNLLSVLERNVSPEHCHVIRVILVHFLDVIARSANISELSESQILLVLQDVITIRAEPYSDRHPLRMGCDVCRVRITIIH
jgi:hypothetical protein